MNSNCLPPGFILYYPSFKDPPVWDYPLGEEVRKLKRLTLPIRACLPSGKMIKLSLEINIKISDDLQNEPNFVAVERNLLPIFKNNIPIVTESRYSQQNYIFSNLCQNSIEKVLQPYSLHLVSLRAFLL